MNGTRYYQALAEEILQQTEARLDYLFVGVETGVCITGLASYLKQKIPYLKVVGVEPTDSVFGDGKQQHVGRVASLPIGWAAQQVAKRKSRTGSLRISAVLLCPSRLIRVLWTNGSVCQTRKPTPLPDG